MVMILWLFSYMSAAEIKISDIWVINYKLILYNTVGLSADKESIFLWNIYLFVYLRHYSVKWILIIKQQQQQKKTQKTTTTTTTTTTKKNKKKKKQQKHTQNKTTPPPPKKKKNKNKKTCNVRINKMLHVWFKNIFDFLLCFKSPK